MGPRTGLDGCEKSCLPTGPDPRTVQGVASRYTAYSIPAHIVLKYGSQFLGAFAKLRKATISFVRVEQLGSHWTDFHEI